MSSSRPPASEEDASYTAMATAADPFQAGVHCSFCNRLDFLPFRCESCKAQFCIDHRTETSHDCPKAGDWAKRRAAQNGIQTSTTSAAKKPNILTHEAQCAQSSCKTLIDTPLVQGIGCQYCRRRYCLRHRMREDHDCDKIAAANRAAQKSDGGLNNALGRLRAWGAQKKAAAAAAASSSSTTSSTRTATASNSLSKTATQSSTSSQAQATLHRIISPFTSRKSGSKTAQLVATNALKKTAKGDAKVPAERRLYVRLEAVGEGEGRAGAKIPKADAFYDRDWKVGRVLDAIAKTLAIENLNNREITEEQRLRVFWIEGGRLLAFSEKIGEAKAEVGDRTLVSGDTLVLLRGVGPV